MIIISMKNLRPKIVNPFLHQNNSKGSFFSSFWKLINHLCNIYNVIFMRVYQGMFFYRALQKFYRIIFSMKSLRPKRPFLHQNSSTGFLFSSFWNLTYQICNIYSVIFMKGSSDITYHLKYSFWSWQALSNDTWSSKICLVVKKLFHFFGRSLEPRSALNESSWGQSTDNLSVSQYILNTNQKSKNFM